MIFWATLHCRSNARARQLESENLLIMAARVRRRHFGLTPISAGDIL
jgi:hypothetical protein